MNNDTRAHTFEQDKSNERKRKAAYLESIFENGEKKVSKENGTVNNGVKCTESPNQSTRISVTNNMTNSSVTKRSSTNDTTSRYRQNRHSPIDNSSKKERITSTNANQQTVKPGETVCVSQPTTPYVSTAKGARCPTPRDEEKASADLENSVVVKQEKDNENMAVQIVSVQGSHEQKLDSEAELDKDGITDDYMKFLLFAGRLYRCSQVTDVTHNAMRFDPETVQGRKGKVVVLLLFHKTYREIMSYVVGVVEHTTSKDQTITIKVIKSQTYPTSLSPQKDSDAKEFKFVVGSKKLLYNMQSLDGPIYGELVKILDGFGANSAVDHVKISEFNAMINANADRFDGQLPSYPGTLALSFPRTGNFVSSAPFTYLGPRVSKSNVRYNAIGNRPSRDCCSPGQSHAGPQGNMGERPNSRGPRSDIDNGLLTYAAHGRQVKCDQPLYTVAANRTARISPGGYNGLVSSEHPRNVTAVPVSAHFHSAMRDEVVQDRAIASPRRNVQDLQTVAELCKEKMKRDMAEQELKSIKAAFEEFKSQMQHHLSQVEERMVHLEAENRTLKGKLSNMHQTNGYAEKKYHELRARLEEVLKTV